MGGITLKKQLLRRVCKELNDKLDLPRKIVVKNRTPLDLQMQIKQHVLPHIRWEWKNLNKLSDEALDMLTSLDCIEQGELT